MKCYRISGGFACTSEDGSAADELDHVRGFPGVLLHVVDGPDDPEDLPSPTITLAPDGGYPSRNEHDEEDRDAKEAASPSAQE